MSSDLIFIRDSVFGRTVYNLTGKKVFTHPEESPDYIVPDKYLSPSKESDSNNEGTKEVVVDWEGPDDLENPKNWPMYRKLIFISMVGLLTISIYIASSIYVPGVDQIMEEFNTPLTVAYLPLSMFVIGYGIGPMIFAPLSEHPALGRVYVYATTLFIFVILQIPTALVKNIAGFVILRFLAGVFSSPALATGGASVGDVLSLTWVPFGLATWGMCATCGPVLGPLIGGVLSEKVGWRWTIWFLLIFDGFTLLVLFFFFPESSKTTLLYRKAQRLRKITGLDNIVSEGDIHLRKLNPKQMLFETFWRPFEIGFNEPVVFFINLYCGLMYAIMYLWFEAFPIVFVEIHGFNMILTGVGYVSIMVGNALGNVIHSYLIYGAFTKPMSEGKMPPPETFLPTCIVGAVLQPIGVFIFAWSSTASVHWIAPLIGATIFSCGSFNSFQTLANYLAFSFPRYQASVFAGNALFRGAFGGAFPLFARYLYKNIGSDKFPVGWGCSILGFATFAMILIPVLFYINGVRLRARSKYAN